MTTENGTRERHLGPSRIERVVTPLIMLSIMAILGVLVVSMAAIAPAPWMGFIVLALLLPLAGVIYLWGTELVDGIRTWRKP